MIVFIDTLFRFLRIVRFFVVIITRGPYCDDPGEHQQYNQGNDRVHQISFWPRTFVCTAGAQEGNLLSLKERGKGEREEHIGALTLRAQSHNGGMTCGTRRLIYPNTQTAIPGTSRSKRSVTVLPKSRLGPDVP